MMDTRRVGLVVISASLASAVVYIFAILFYQTIVVTLTALVFMLLLLGLLTWIGYTMLTEPASVRPLPSSADLDKMDPETINPKPLSDASRVGSRLSVIVDCSIGEGTIVRDQVNLYKCKIGKNCKIESFVYIEEGVTVGDHCKIKPNVFIPTGVTIEDDVMIGPNVTFTNDKHPRVTDDWELLQTTIARGASIGAHAVILPGIRIGENAIVGAGAVVTKSVPDNAVAVGNPARLLAKSEIREQ